jgi:hypothetical protein
MIAARFLDHRFAGGGINPFAYRDTCAETATHLPFCFAQQSV